ncbi:hypothetical protein KPL71_027231 [Citrus sinensis]|uniref:Uncharacterized protein n=1 Tax=Citrus sinensis TaxID=2711 RepID=A0ACB8I542_CITSI|nr:hypothetical protein KPL71_027231 [Citrus sinensis]
MPSLDSEAYQTWPQIRTDILRERMEILMLNRVKGSYCEIRQGEIDAVAVVHSFEDGMPPGSHKTRLTALNVPPMGLLDPKLLVPDAFNDYDEDMLEDTWHTYFLRRSDISDNFYPGINVGLPMWESYHSFDN